MKAALAGTGLVVAVAGGETAWLVGGLCLAVAAVVLARIHASRKQRAARRSAPSRPPASANRRSKP